MKLKFLTATKHDTMFWLWLWSVFIEHTWSCNQQKQLGRPKKWAPSKVCFVGRDYRMHRKIGSYWVDCRDPIDLIDHSSDMEIGLDWYQGNQQWMDL